MATLALSKTSLQQQRDKLRLFELFPATPELKRQQSRRSTRRLRVLAQAEQGADQASHSLTDLLPILAARR
jgi:hypothetical protein